MADPEPKIEASAVTQKTRACGPTEVDPFDDMHDNQNDWDQYVSLLPLKEFCKIGEAFDEADADAKYFQVWHRIFTCSAAVLATFALVLAIAGLGYVAAEKMSGPKPPEQKTQDVQSAEMPQEPDWEARLDALEIRAAALTVIVVVMGYFLHLKERWLRARHRAELFRLLRYNLLIQPSVWNDGLGVEQWIERKIDDIRRLTDRKLEDVLNEPSPPGPYEPTHSLLGRHRLQALTQYYLAKRLGPQKEYFANRAQRNEIKDKMRFWLPFFFFSSILAVAAKLITKHFEHPWLAFGFLMAATLLPVLAAGIRTYLGAFEFSRNKSRFYAAHKALSDTEKSLVRNTFQSVTAEPAGQIREESVLVGSHLGPLIVVAEEAGAGTVDSDETDAHLVLKDLAWCEHVLDAEHREWLRLMHDAEWFG